MEHNDIINSILRKLFSLSFMKDFFGSFVSCTDEIYTWNLPVLFCFSTGKGRSWILWIPNFKTWIPFRRLLLLISVHYINMQEIIMRVLAAQSCLTLCDSRDCSPSGSSVRGISQARILEWVAIPFSRRSSQSRDQTQVCCIADGFFTVWVTRECKRS